MIISLNVTFPFGLSNCAYDLSLNVYSESNDLFNGDWLLSSFQLIMLLSFAVDYPCLILLRRICALLSPYLNDYFIVKSQLIQVHQNQIPNSFKDCRIYSDLKIRFRQQDMSMQNKKHSSQQYSNIERKYIIRQNKQLKLQIRQLKQVNQVHKRALIRLSQQHLPHNQVISTLIQLIRGKPTVKRDLHLIKKIDQLQSQMMVMEKIADQASNSQKETYNLLAEEFKLLRKSNVQKQEALNKFYQKIGQVDYLSGLVTKFVEIANPSEQVIAFQKQKQQLLDALNLLKDQNKKIIDQKDKLMKINIHLKEQLDRRKDEVRNMTMYLNNTMVQHGQVVLEDLENQNILNNSVSVNSNSNNISTTLGKNGNYSSLNNTLNFIRLQKELIKQNNDEQQSDASDMQAILDCPELYNLFPDKVQKISANRQQKRVPYLNMLKVRQLMAKRQTKLKKEMDDANANVNPTQKIIRLQGQLEITRKQLTSLMLKFRSVSDDIKKSSGIIQQLQYRNVLLLEANKNLIKYNQSLRQQNLAFRKTISKIETVTGRKLMNQNINEQEMVRLLLPSTRRNTWDQILSNVLVSIPNHIKRSASL